MSTVNEDRANAVRSIAAWLRGTAASAGDLVTPDEATLLLGADVIDAASEGFLQRDPSFTIPDEVKVTLKRPLKRVGAPDEPELTELSFRPPTAGEAKKIHAAQEKRGAAEAGIAMLSLLSNDKLLEKDIERLTAIDAQMCGEKLSPFLGLTPLSGGGRR